MLPIHAVFEEGAEAADAVREHDAVKAGLHIGMLVADVEIAAGGRILGNSRKPQHDLLDRGVRALRQRLDRVVADRCRRRARRRVNGVEALVESGGLGGERVRRRRPHRGGRSGASARCRGWFGLRLRAAHQNFGKLHLRGGDADAADRGQRRRPAKQPWAEDAAEGRAANTNIH